MFPIHQDHTLFKQIPPEYSQCSSICPRTNVFWFRNRNIQIPIFTPKASKPPSFSGKTESTMSYMDLIMSFYIFKLFVLKHGNRLMARMSLFSCEHRVSHHQCLVCQDNFPQHMRVTLTSFSKLFPLQGACKYAT